MKILYITTIGGTMSFFQSFIGELLTGGHTVDIATNETTSEVLSRFRQWGCHAYHLPWSRTPFSTGNIKAIRELRKIISNGRYDIVHCHTPIAAVCTRIACRPLRKNGIKVIYTAHGFHFYKGAPLKNWLIYYPIEWICAHWTDMLITINKEDHGRAEKHMHAKYVEYIPGVGIDVEKFANTAVDCAVKRREIGVPEDAFLLLSVGELNANKNHKVVIRALAQLNDENIHYAVAGQGDLRDDLFALAKELGVGRQVHLLGYRSDVAELYKTADVYVLPSFREGLNVSVMEALAGGLPVICSRIRGNVDMVQDGENGLWCEPGDTDTFANAIERLYRIPELCRGMAARAETSALSYRFQVINKGMCSIYEQLMGDNADPEK